MKGKFQEPRIHSATA